MRILKITETGLAHTGRIVLNGLILVGGTANSSITLNDSTDGTGDDTAGAKALANSSSPNAIPVATVFEAGVYATISGSGAVAYAFIE